MSDPVDLRFVTEDVLAGEWLMVADSVANITDLVDKAIEQAGDNPIRTLMIASHGAEGTTGFMAFDSETAGGEVIAGDNKNPIAHPVITEQFGRLSGHWHRKAIIEIRVCEFGTGPNGTKAMQSLADAAGVPVTAPTGTMKGVAVFGGLTEDWKTVYPSAWDKPPEVSFWVGDPEAPPYSPMRSSIAPVGASTPHPAGPSSSKTFDEIAAASAATAAQLDEDSGSDEDHDLDEFDSASDGDSVPLETETDGTGNEKSPIGLTSIGLMAAGAALILFLGWFLFMRGGPVDVVAEPSSPAVVGTSASPTAASSSDTSASVQEEVPAEQQSEELMGLYLTDPAGDVACEDPDRTLDSALDITAVDIVQDGDEMEVTVTFDGDAEAFDKATTDKFPFSVQLRLKEETAGYPEVFFAEKTKLKVSGGLLQVVGYEFSGEKLIVRLTGRTLEDVHSVRASTFVYDGGLCQDEVKSEGYDA